MWSLWIDRISENRNEKRRIPRCGRKTEGETKAFGKYRMPSTGEECLIYRSGKANRPVTGVIGYHMGPTWRHQGLGSTLVGPWHHHGLGSTLVGPSGFTGVNVNVDGLTDVNGPTSGFTVLHGEDFLGTVLLEDCWLSAAWDDICIGDGDLFAAGHRIVVCHTGHNRSTEDQGQNQNQRLALQNTWWQCVPCFHKVYIVDHVDSTGIEQTEKTSLVLCLYFYPSQSPQNCQWAQ